MPSRLSTLRRLLSASSRRPIGLKYCPACSIWRISSPQAAQHNAAQSTLSPSVSRSRRSSTVASTTAINATRDLPPNLRELHEALSELRSKAANYVDLSRLQLALRGLETRDAVIRVAGTIVMTIIFCWRMEANDVLVDSFGPQRTISGAEIGTPFARGCTGAGAAMGKEDRCCGRT